MRFNTKIAVTAAMSLGLLVNVYAKEGSISGNEYISSDGLVSVGLPPTRNSIRDSAKKPGQMSFVEFCYDCNYPMMEAFYSLEWFKMTIPADKKNSQATSKLFLGLPEVMSASDKLTPLGIQKLNTTKCKFITLQGEKAYQCIANTVENLNRFMCATTIIRKGVLLNAYFVLPQSSKKSKPDHISGFDTYEKFLKSVQVHI